MMEQYKYLKTAFHLSLYIALAYFSYLMWLITWQYVPIDFQAAFLKIKQAEIQLVHYQYAFFIHVYTSIIVLLLGFSQFSVYIRKKWARLHQVMGKAYIGLILFLAGPSGLIMAYYANGGFSSQFSFSILALLWLYFTYKAWQSAKKKQWRKHQSYMYRSYALTLSAISLRLFKWIIVALFQPAPMDTYRLVAWLGWVANLAIAEWLIWRKH